MIVGLTGGIATGKSTFSCVLLELGVYVLDADVIARAVVEPGTEGLRRIVEAFGEGVLQAEGTLDRGKLGSVIFADAQKREILNGIVHPLVRTAMWSQAREYVKGDARRIAVLDIPLLFEGNTQGGADLTVLIYAPLDLQLARLQKRNGFAEEEARRRIAAQLPMEEKLRLADVIVHNTGAEVEVPGLATKLLIHLREVAQVGAESDGTFDKRVVKRTEIR